MRYAIIGDEETVLSFGMVGVSGQTAASPDEAETVFQELLEDKDVGIIIVTENVADMMRATVDKYLFTVSFPLIVEIPDRKGAKPGRRGFKELVNGAIGIKL